MRDGEEDALLAIEHRATVTLLPWFPSLADHSVPPDRFRRALGESIVFVAAGPGNHPVGFAIASDLEGLFWLHEISVDPAHAGIGLGTGLLSAVFDRARWALHTAIGLTTFRDVPFNRPWYERHGFMEAAPEKLPPALQQRVRDEVPPGILPSARVVMMKRL